MRVAGAFEGLSGSELLDEVDVLRATQRRTELLILKAAVQHAVLNHEGTLMPGRVGLPGRERAVRLGGLGTPLVAEFCAAELGARLEMSSFGAQRLMADGLELAHRFLRLWARVEDLEAPESPAMPMSG